MAPSLSLFPRAEESTGFKIHPAIIALGVVIIVFPFLIFFIYRRRIWLSPLWKPISYKIGKRRYEADKRQLARDFEFVDTKPATRDNTPSPHRPRNDYSRQAREQDVYPVLPQLSYQHNAATYAAQPMQRVALSNVPHLPQIEPFGAHPPPDYNAPYISPLPVAAACYPPRHSPRHRPPTPPRKATSTAKKSEFAKSNPFYPVCVNEQMEAGSQFVNDNNRARLGRRLV